MPPKATGLNRVVLHIEYEITQTFGTLSLTLIATIKGASAVALLMLQISPTWPTNTETHTQIHTHKYTHTESPEEK